MRVLITGGYGYIGGRLAQYLFTHGREVFLGSRNLHQRTNWLPEAKNILINWCDPLSLTLACKHIDVIIHTSGMNAKESKLNSLEALKVNGQYTDNLLQAAKTQKVKRFIYLSTAHVYSAPLLGHINENTPLKNLHPYATSHLAGENFILSDNQITGFVLRISNAFGPPTHRDVNCWMLLVNDLCRQAIEKRAMTLNSDISQLRDFITLTDVISAIDSFIEMPPNKFNDVYNLGGEFSINIFQMAGLIGSRCRALFNYSPEIIIREKDRAYSQSVLKYDIEKLKSTGFKLAKKINDEIDATLLFCLENFSNRTL
ncbi:SDR family oxidoreductase [Candidatus Methylopumilus rimovensis]|uniref:SDR family oxidoreductase n=1 Tax=Candidatus Methylopumilus rimovensis TaxID=2588535 RepID=A0AAE6KNZ8_9PROT|nr:NAD-dependent epimerase/dehydratase [Candidatus Methylopumilus rimovensis]QDD13379.1 SDR family oxidoreductase [Candidatus Methylopumilus rimovensis]